MSDKLKHYKIGETLKILFMRSGGHFTDIYKPDAPLIVPPKSILYLAGVFKNDDSVQTRLLDVLAHPDFRLIRKEWRNPPFYFGMAEEDVIRKIREYNPHVVAMTSTAN